jgi:hypothetical protein
MMKKIIFIFLFALLAYSSLALSAKAQNITNTLTGLNETAGKVDAFKADLGGTFDAGFMATRVGQIIGIVLSFIGVLFLGLMIYAGIMWMTAGGNEQLVTKSKDLITSAIIGLVIVIGAYALTTYIGDFILNNSNSSQGQNVPEESPPVTDFDSLKYNA